MKFACVQALVQVIGFAAGLLIVRNLPKREYAFYTIGNTMLSTILVLADSGISSALTAIGGRVWQDSRRLGSLLNTALQLRRQMVVVTLLAVVPSSSGCCHKMGPAVGRSSHWWWLFWWDRVWSW